ncbi:adenosylmethionine--8-amino-7-oxononanoate transaminase [Filimonas effusa]|uniref:Adenosylmethionine-8-amino-7-oxononanoate aminotransferase n=1 Tax=Filimonas effusa TaxID=2508721 RepID=A0A4Q1DA13_9BACT|nr:adenosylmethionine--8-amino-7-oxononanoate transaminase [Filimonas effusa]RXK86214.1 adenosylmethionine--8-amino-7-oxononanoate transaminase [Filimonas effusa]
MRTSSLAARDERVNWHPYTQMKTASPVIPIVRGEGTYLFDEQGKRYIDAISSWWVTLHGHAHPYIASQVSKQLHTLEHVIFAGFTHRPAIELSERLLSLLPGNQRRIFYSDNGSTAVEVALKMSIQYHFNNGARKLKVLALRDAYHGDTFGAMSVSGRSRWTVPFNDLLFEVVFIDRPSVTNLAAIKQVIDVYAEAVACFIYEPLVQGAGGMLMYEADVLSQLMLYCRQKGILLIQDEVFTGFGRTGQLFAANHLTEQPDIMCFSKGLTGGTMAMGVTSCSEMLYEAFYSSDRYKTLFHGHSFTANPLACAAALASLDLLVNESTQDNIHRICRQHAHFIERIRQHQGIGVTRQCGTIVALEPKESEGTGYFYKDQQRLYHQFLSNGVLLRPLGSVVYIVPPYCISPEDLDLVYEVIETVITQ